MKVFSSLSFLGVFRHSWNSSRRILKIALLTALGWMVAFPSAWADDLAQIKTQVLSDFGSGSTVVNLLVLAEIFGCAYAYHKTKNLGVLLGAVILSVFLTFALTHLIFTT